MGVNDELFTVKFFQDRTSACVNCHVLSISSELEGTIHCGPGNCTCRRRKRLPVGKRTQRPNPGHQLLLKEDSSRPLN